MSARRLALSVVGAVSALALASAPLVASADTGHVIPVRLSPKGGYAANPTTYLAPVAGAYAVVHRDDNRVRFLIHDPSGLVPNTPVAIAVFNHPENCAPANTTGKHVFDPSGHQAALCDPGVDAGNPATGFHQTLGPTITLDRYGNFAMTVTQGAVLTNPKGAEVVVFELATRHIMFSSPRLHHEDADEGSDD